TTITIKILEQAGLNPSFLVGGFSSVFGVSSRYTDYEYFVIEADEYDTAFFDKLSKLIHYDPSIFVINNIEFDHADIFKDIDAIFWK
ncbi:Mur ligase family protein, partial [Francisella tularensis subsp. holarctica]|uniref:Mur ligase family protein n=1 Tax=Francisella tularensis TaxID=263 RepID=UPI002381C264